MRDGEVVNPNPAFEQAIVPLLANPEPWLEKAINIGSPETLSVLMEVPPRAVMEYIQVSKRALQVAMKDVVPGSEVQEKRAVARAKAMATLHCGYVGCRTVVLPGHNSKICSGCKCVKYCSEACLKADWKKNHKSACKAIAAGAGK